MVCLALHRTSTGKLRLTLLLPTSYSRLLSATQARDFIEALIARKEHGGGSNPLENINNAVGILDGVSGVVANGVSAAQQ